MAIITCSVVLCIAPSIDLTFRCQSQAVSFPRGYCFEFHVRITTNKSSQLNWLVG
jgi:hypothetical protein